IPRPPGALSKPTAGGYALKDALGWEDATYKYVQKVLHSICLNHLEVARPYHEQSTSALTKYCVAALKEFPALANYVDHWPARDFAKMYMKNINAQRKANQGCTT
ncbi:hypothetical protein P692DRAFT_201727322, partial [Suillus brevipes Sb2]